MKITDFAISNRTAIIVLTIALSIGGLISYFSLPKVHAMSTATLSMQTGEVISMAYHGLQTFPIKL